MASTTTLFVNKTSHTVKLKVGNSQYSSDVASIEGGGKYRMHVNMNDTYREIMVGVDSDEEKRVIVVTSDDCCDFQCITIKENDGRLDLLKEPRQRTAWTSADQDAGAVAKRPWFRRCCGSRTANSLAVQ